MRFQQSRQREEESIGFTSDRIAEELEKEALVASLTKQVNEKAALINGYNADLKKLVVKGTEAQAKRYTELSEAAQALARRSVQKSAPRNPSLGAVFGARTGEVPSALASPRVTASSTRRASSKRTSAFCGCTFTSTRAGSMSIQTTPVG